MRARTNWAPPMAAAAAGLLLLAACSGSNGTGAAGPAGPAGPAGLAGAKGDKGDTGLQGPAGPSGPIGPTGQAGSQGSTGAQGIQGVQGPVGPAGPKGDPGTTSLVSATAVTGPAGAIAQPGSGNCLATGVGFQFLGGTGSQVNNIVLGNANQVINVAAAFDLGTTINGAGNLYLDVCYQPAGGQLVAPPTSLGPLALPGNAHMPFVLSKAVQPPAAGTYTVGICGCVNGGDSWSPGFGWLSVQVLQK